MRFSAISFIFAKVRRFPVVEIFEILKMSFYVMNNWNNLSDQSPPQGDFPPPVFSEIKPTWALTNRLTCIFNCIHVLLKNFKLQNLTPHARSDTRGVKRNPPNLLETSHGLILWRVNLVNLSRVWYPRKCFFFTLSWITRQHWKYFNPLVSGPGTVQFRFEGGTV